MKPEGIEKPMNSGALEAVAHKMVANGRGILAADESSGTADKNMLVVASMLLPMARAGEPNGTLKSKNK